MPKLLYLITEDWWFCQHFLPMARAARAAGYEVAVAARLRDHAVRIAEEGYRTVALENERRSFGADEVLRSMLRMVRILRAERPDLVHCIGLRMVVLGGLAARLAGAREVVLAPTGLGHLWIANGLIERLVRPMTRLLVGHWLRRPGTHYLFENSDDPRELGLDAHGPEVTLVGGAGVSAEKFTVAAEPPPPVKVAVVARMIAAKGIRESVAAILRARALGVAVELHLFGAPDPSNRRSIGEAELRDWSKEPGIFWHGPTSDVAAVWRAHHVAMLLTYGGEGLPRTLVEATASGRPVITTRVAGCREIVRDGREGLLVPPRDVEAAASAVGRLAADPALRARLGAAARDRFLEGFSEAAVMSTMHGLYKSLARPGGGVGP